ncbi:MAG: PhoH family protein [Thermodesulfobacteriota bacterium]
MKKTQSSTRKITLEDNDLAMTLFGQGGANMKWLERKLGLAISTRGNVVTLSGGAETAGIAERLITELYALLRRGYRLSAADMDYALRLVSSGGSARLEDVFTDVVFTTFRKKSITPKSIGQKRYIDAIRGHDIVFSIGPAGTGKTYLAMAMAVSALMEKSVERIVLTRPAVEAGEKLGFLPGDIAAKVDPYLRPLYDALQDMLDYDRAESLLEKGVIEVAPLAFMRGRTLNDSFIILDEAQNTTVEQMKMFLTRLGFGSKAVVTGDITQIDLPLAKPSGLVEARMILEGVDGIGFVEFTEKDVVRHPLVSEVIKAFKKFKEEKSSLIEIEE